MIIEAVGAEDAALPCWYANASPYAGEGIPGDPSGDPYMLYVPNDPNAPDGLAVTGVR